MPDGDWLGVNVKRNSKSVEMKWSNTFGYLKPMGPNKTLFKYIINADP